MIHTSTIVTQTLSKLSRNSKLFKEVIKAIQDKKAEQIISVDLRNIPEAVADFFIICSASSISQMKAICDLVDERLFVNCGEKPYHYEKQNTSQWILIDYVNIVLHVMHPDARKYYQLEEMWSDAPQMGHDIEDPFKTTFK